MFFFDKKIRTLVCVRGMQASEWLKDHPSFKQVSAKKAGEITVRENFTWTLPVYYYGGDPAYDGASIATAVSAEHAIL